MGGDGGSIPGRQDLVRTKRKPEQAQKEFERVAKWRHCSITQEPLRQPIVACQLGMLYNKEAVLEYLIETEKVANSNCEHIKSLKDIKDLNLTDNPTFKKDEIMKGGGVYNDTLTAEYVCPVTGLEMNGRYKFCFLWKCGCVFAERALKEIKSDACHNCGKAFDDDWIILNGTVEEVDVMKSKMEERKAKIKAEKKAKKAKKRKADECVELSKSSSAAQDLTVTSKVQNEGNDGVFKIPILKSTQVKCAKKSDHEEKTLEKEKKIDKNFKTQERNEKDKKRTTYKPETSNVYKSLFVNKDEKPKEKSHWVTYNPYYS